MAFHLIFLFVASVVFEVEAVPLDPVTSKKRGSIELCAEDLRLNLGQKVLSAKIRKKWCEEESEATLNCVKMVYFDLPLHIDVYATRNLCRHYQAEVLLQAVDLFQEQEISPSFEAAVRAAFVGRNWISVLNCKQVL